MITERRNGKAAIQRTFTTAILFCKGRINFCHVDGRRASTNSGAPSCFVAYGALDAIRLKQSKLQGKVIALK